jgi:methylated-DNA-[protein]-cysteine S-methyltransferase
VNTCKYDIIKISLGYLTVIFTDKGVSQIRIWKQVPGYSQITPSPAKHPVFHKACPAPHPQKLYPEWRQQLESYFQGKSIIFTIPLDIQEGTAFRRKVWRVLQRIPYGETRSYRWVAEQIGKSRAFRAVGQANAANPIPIIIPCHRVIQADGSLGGFSCGTNIKKELLRLEGILQNSRNFLP